VKDRSLRDHHWQGCGHSDELDFLSAEHFHHGSSENSIRERQREVGTETKREREGEIVREKLRERRQPESFQSVH
jgi:hypothetical protein